MICTPEHEGDPAWPRRLVATAWSEGCDGGRWSLRGNLRLTASRAVLASAQGTGVERDPSRHFPAFRAWLADQDAWADKDQP